MSADRPAWVQRIHLQMLRGPLISNCPECKILHSPPRGVCPDCGFNNIPKTTETAVTNNETVQIIYSSSQK